jgi:hypothetical protein
MLLWTDSSWTAVPFGLSLRNQSFFWSLVMMSTSVVVHSVPYVSLSSSRRIWTACPLGVFIVMRWMPLAFFDGM